MRVMTSPKHRSRDSLPRDAGILTRLSIDQLAGTVSLEQPVLIHSISYSILAGRQLDYILLNSA